jgi:DNA helicase IV
VHPELATEQALIDRAYARVDTLREEALTHAKQVVSDRIGRGIETMHERDALFSERIARVAHLSIGDEALVFGRIDTVQETGGSPDPLYIGRIGVSDDDRSRLVVDWRTKVAEPFYRATAGDPMGVVRRRHLHSRGRVLLGLDDELLTEDADEASDLTLVGEAALMRAMQLSRTGRMRDIVATIQREQDEIIRAPLQGTLVVQGGPGTGKTAVGLHRASYLVYEHRKRLEHSGILFVGPNPVFLRYVEHVLPALGEHDVRMTTPAGLVNGIEATGTDTYAAERVKGDGRMVDLLRRAVADRERGLTEPVSVRYDGEKLTLTPKAMQRLVAVARKTRGPHNAKRDLVLRSVMKHLIELYRSEVRSSVRSGIRPASPWEAGNMPHGSRVDFFRDMLDEEPIRRAIDEMWPDLSPQRALRELFASEERLQTAARGVLSDGEWRTLSRVPSEDWTPGDVALLDELNVLLGRRAQRRGDDEQDVAKEDKWWIDRMLTEMAADDPMIDQMRDQLMERFMDERRASDRDRQALVLRETFGHVVVDEAQDLSPMQWRMIGRRIPSRSMTILGDLGQATSAWAPKSWEQALEHLGRNNPIEQRELTINYRTPAEIMDAASDVLVGEDLDLPRPNSVRRAGHPPLEISVPRAELVAATVEHVRQLRKQTEGTVCVVAQQRYLDELRSELGSVDGAQVLESDIAVLEVTKVKGLEFDAVVIADRAAVLADQGPRALYVAMSRPTQTLTMIDAV